MSGALLAALNSRKRFDRTGETIAVTNIDAKGNAGESNSTSAASQGTRRRSR